MVRTDDEILHEAMNALRYHAARGSHRCSTYVCNPGGQVTARVSRGAGVSDDVRYSMSEEYPGGWDLVSWTVMATNEAADRLIAARWHDPHKAFAATCEVLWWIHNLDELRQGGWEKTTSKYAAAESHRRSAGWAEVRAKPSDPHTGHSRTSRAGR